MIHYQLKCDTGHEFDGWFAGSNAFDDQCARGLVTCPYCNSTGVERALMTPNVVTREKKRPEKHPNLKEAHPKQAETAKQGGDLPDVLRAKLQRLRREVEQNCEYLGPDFAAEARRIAEGEIPARPIYGEATKEEADALREDGIEVSRIPWIKRADG